MSGPYDAQCSQEYGQFIDRPVAATTEALPPAFSEHFAQMPSTGNAENLGAIGLLGHCLGLSRSQFERLLEPPALYAYHLFLNQITRNQIAMDYSSQQTTLRDPGRSPADHWSPLDDIPESSNHPVSSDAASPRPAMTSTGTMPCTRSHHPVLLYSGTNMPHEMNARRSYSPADAAHPHDSPRPSMDHPTPFASPGLCDSDPQSSPISITSAPDPNEGASQSCDSPQSTCWSPPYPQHNSDHIPNVQGSPKIDHTLPAPTPQIGNTGGLRLILWNPGSPPHTGKSRRKPKTPCPKCRKSAFESRHEFVKHMKVVHERSVRFVCNHRILRQNGEQYCCPKSLYHFSDWKRHHTQRHPECTEKQSRHVPVGECRQEIVERPPVRQRGCWLCNHLSLTVEDWVDHHLSRHKACSRRIMSQTWAMKSLLSHPDITFYWQMQIRNLEVTTGYFWNIKWPEDAMDPTMVELMICLETGLFKDKNFHKDTFVRAQVAEAAMDATIDTREIIAAIPQQQLLEFGVGLNSLRRDLAVAARSKTDLTPGNTQVQHVTASSALSLYHMRDLVYPWLDNQLGEGDTYPNYMGLTPGEPWPSYLDREE